LIQLRSSKNLKVALSRDNYLCDASESHVISAADLTSANNVLAYVPDINDFVGGFAILLKPSGVLNLRVPHLLEMARNDQFDTARAGSQKMIGKSSRDWGVIRTRTTSPSHFGGETPRSAAQLNAKQLKWVM
jgi:trans-aconitate methyltransferase